MDARLEKVFKLPTKQKLALLAVIILLIGCSFFFLMQKPKTAELKDLQAKLDGLSAQIQETRRIANNLPKYKAEYAQLQKELENALTELPNQKEIPSLLVSITSAGKAAGLDFLTFKPKPEVPKDFYAEVPVDIVVSGPYQSVGNFFVAVGSLPRIVNMNNVAFSDVKFEKGRSLLKVTSMATTFRFLDKKEIKDDKKDKAKK